MILDQCICISRGGAYVDDCDNWNIHASEPEDSITTSKVCPNLSLERPFALSVTKMIS